MNKRIYLCLAHMSGQEQKYIKEAFDTNWVVPLGPNVNGFEEDLKQFVESNPNGILDPSSTMIQGIQDLYPENITHADGKTEKIGVRKMWI